MPKVDLSDTILVIKPVGSNALQSKHNADRLTLFYPYSELSTFTEGDDSKTRESTPFIPPPMEVELHLKFSPLPRDPARGFTFGADPKSCDIVLLHKGARSVSREHFCIDFNWESGYMRLNNIDRFGTGIKASSIINGYKLLKCS